MMKAGLIEEMMSEAIDSAVGGEDEEEETEEEIQKVCARHGDWGSRQGQLLARHADICACGSLRWMSPAQVLDEIGLETASALPAAKVRGQADYVIVRGHGPAIRRRVAAGGADELDAA
jgi:hypothetical protein